MMVGSKWKGLLALLLLAVAAPAWADVTWLVSGAFDDGSTLAGSFTLNQYGFVSAVDLTTQSQGVFTGVNYVLQPTFPANNGFNFLEIDPGPYTGALRLNFDGPIADANGPIAGTVSILSTSFECQNSQNCQAAGGNTRFLVGGSASSSVPEPASWAMMIAGFGMVGAAMRRRRGVSAEARG